MNIDNEFQHEIETSTDKVAVEDFMFNEIKTEPKPRPKRKVYREMEKEQRKLDKKKAMKK